MRAHHARRTTKLEGAVAVDWRQFSRREAAMRGRLLASDDALATQLQAIGVSQRTPVVVVADAHDPWGEDGRIVWMLRALGHGEAALVDGGVAALLAEGPLTIAPPPTRGDFVVTRDDRRTIECAALRRRLGAVDLAIIDSRTTREYAGATPHGEARGGHIPGAQHLPHRALVRPDGRLLPSAQIRARLERAGIRPELEVVAYCTGGVRSAWLTAVLVQLGYRARNFAGSMWEWSCAPASTHPLVSAAGCTHLRIRPPQLP